MSTPSSVPGTDRAAASDAVRRTPSRRQTGGDPFRAALSAELDSRPSSDDQAWERQNRAAQHRATQERTDQHRATRERTEQHRATHERAEQHRAAQVRAGRHRAEETGTAYDRAATRRSSADGTKPARRRTVAQEDAASGSAVNPSGAGAGVMAVGTRATTEIETSTGKPGSATVTAVSAEAQEQAAVAVDHGRTPADADIPPAEAHDRGTEAATNYAVGPTGAPGAAQIQLGGPAAASDQPTGGPAALAQTQVPSLNPVDQSHTVAQPAAAGSAEAGRPIAATGPGPDHAIAPAGPTQDQAGQAIAAASPTQDQAIAAAGQAPDQAGQAIATTGPGQDQPTAALGATSRGTAVADPANGAGQITAAIGRTGDQAAAVTGADQATAAASPTDGGATGPAPHHASQATSTAGSALSESAGARPAASDALGTTPDRAATPIPWDAAPGVPDHALAGVAGAAPTAAASAPAAPPSAHSAAPPTTPPVAQIAMRIVPLRLEADGVHRLTVNLHPADLGPVQVVAEIRNGDVTLQLSGSTDAGTAALRDSLDDLRRELTDSGFGNCSLDLRDGGGEQSRPQQQYSAARPTPRGEGPTVAPEPASQKAGRLDVRA